MGTIIKTTVMSMGIVILMVNFRLIIAFMRSVSYPFMKRLESAWRIHVDYSFIIHYLDSQVSATLSVHKNTRKLDQRTYRYTLQTIKMIMAKQSIANADVIMSHHPQEYSMTSISWLLDDGYKVYRGITDNNGNSTLEMSRTSAVNKSFMFSDEIAEVNA